MKQFLLCIALLAANLISIPTNAEANSGDFSGAVAIGTSYAGTSAAPTNGLIVQGNVGIGTTSPDSEIVISNTAGATTNSLGSSTLLHVVGAAGYYPTIQMDATAGNATFSGIRYNGSIASPTTIVSGNALLALTAYGYNGSGLSSAQAGLYFFGEGTWSTSSEPTYGAIYVTPSGSTTAAEAMRVDDSGKIGIGTTSPGGQLDVQGTPSFFNGLRLNGQDGSVNQIYQSNAGYVLGITGNNAGLSLGGATSTQHLFINTSGSVGIGTTVPEAPLDVNGQVRIGLASLPRIYESMTIGARPANDGFSSIRLAPYSSTSRGYNIDVYDNNSAYAFQIYDDVNAAVRFYINSSGNVGIGTTSPRGGSTLDVNGKVYVATFASGSSTTVCQNANVLSSCTSASRFKENVEPSDIGLNEVLAMKPVTFDLRDHKDNWEKHDFGFIAEDMEKINPLFVTYDQDGEINGVRYMQLTAVNAKAIQELYAIITEQKNLAASQQEEIDELKRQIQRLDQPK